MAQQMLDEKQLLLLVAEGDEKAFSEFYRAYVPQILPFVTGLVKSSAIADEVIQETFLRLWLSRDKLPEIKEPRAWVFRIASNICYSHIRRLITERKIIDKLSVEQPTQNELEEAQKARELSLLIHEAIDALPPQRKKIYRLSREKGMTIPQIAEHLGLSPSTVKNTLVTSLQSIREFLEKKGYHIPIVILSLLFF